MIIWGLIARKRLTCYTKVGQGPPAYLGAALDAVAVPILALAVG